MNSSYQALACELDRIISSPYPTQLLHLHEIVVTRCSSADISRWASAHPCMLDRLSAVLIEGLQQWPYVLEIITQFAYNESFRNALLSRAPSFLHDTVTHAVKAGGLVSRYSNASIAILSNQLPRSVAIPVHVQDLFVRLAEDVARAPSIATIEPIYLLMKGTGPSLIRILTHEVLHRFEHNITSVLRSSTGMPDQRFSLYCLSIMRLLCQESELEYTLTDSSFKTDDFIAGTPSLPRWKPEFTQQFFTGSKAQRSIQLVVLIVLAISKEVDDMDGVDDRCVSLMLAREIICAMPKTKRSEWCAMNPVTVRKLREKTCGQDMNGVIQTLTTRFIGNLCEVDTLGDVMLHLIETTFLVPEKLRQMKAYAGPEEDRELLEATVERGQLGKSVESTVRWALDSESKEDLMALNAFTDMLVRTSAIASSRSSPAIEDQALIRELVTNLRSLVTRITDQSGKRGVGAALDLANDLQSRVACARYRLAVLKRFAHSVCKWLLSSMLQSSASSEILPGSDGCNSAHEGITVLDMFASTADYQADCTHAQPIAGHQIAYVEEGATQHPISSDWRQALANHLQAQARNDQNAIVRLITAACADLEARCENAEAPLRQQQERCQLLEAQNAEMTSALAELEAQIVDNGIQNNMLEDERDRIVEELRVSRDANKQLFQRVAELETRAREKEANARTCVDEAEAAKRDADLRRKTEIASMQGELEDMQDQVALLQNTVKDHESKLRDAVESLDRATAECETLEVKLEESARDRQAAMEERAIEIEGFQNALTQAEQAAAMAADDLKAAKQALQDLTTEHKRVSHELSKSKEECAESRRDLLAKQQTSLDNDAKHKQATNLLEAEVRNIKQELQESQNYMQSVLEEKDATIVNMQEHIETLQARCDKKDAQIFEAEAMRSNLLAAMGLPAHAYQGKLPDRSRSSSAHRSQPSQTARTPLLLTHTPSKASADLRMHVSFESNTSSESRNGPTPKRARPRRTFTAPSPAKSQSARIGVRASHVSMPPKREPLLGISGNRERLSLKTTEEVMAKQQHGIEAEGDTTFGDTEMFADTQAARLGG